MAKRTIAPNLKRFLSVASLPTRPNGAWTEESSALWAAADRELRDVRTLVRASERLRAGLRSQDWADHVDFERALSRLARPAGRSRQ